MKQMMWILTVLLLPSLSSAQSRGDMLPFQGPRGAMATLASSREPAASAQSVQEQILSDLSEEGVAFKQVIDIFKSGIGLQLTNGQKRNNAEVVEQIMSALTEQGQIAQAFSSYLIIQQHKMTLAQQALAAEGSMLNQNVSGKDVSGGDYLSFAINRRVEERKVESQREKMLKERQALLRYLNQSGDITLADYLSVHVETSSLLPADKESILQWINELNAAK